MPNQLAIRSRYVSSSEVPIAATINRTLSLSRINQWNASRPTLIHCIATWDWLDESLAHSLEKSPLPLWQMKFQDASWTDAWVLNERTQKLMLTEMMPIIETLQTYPKETSDSPIEGLWIGCTLTKMIATYMEGASDTDISGFRASSDDPDFI